MTTDVNQTYPCPRCQVGHCQCSTIPYLSVYGEMLVSVPDMPVWTCDICGFYEYERDALARLDSLMNSGNGKQRRPRTKTPANRISRRVKP